MVNKKTKQKKVKNVDTPNGQILVGCVVLGIAAGFFTNQIVAGTLMGVGIGFILKGILDRKRNNLK